MITRPILVSNAAIENRQSAIYCPRKSSSTIEPNIKLILIPTRMSSKAKRMKSRFGFTIRMRMAKNKNEKDMNKICIKL